MQAGLETVTTGSQVPIRTPIMRSTILRGSPKIDEVVGKQLAVAVTGSR